MYTVSLKEYIYYIYMCVCERKRKKFIMAEIMRTRMFKMLLTSVSVKIQ